MVQQTTEEFGKRLVQAVESHPLSPKKSHGRITWLQQQLELQGDLKVSLNTVHKWYTGKARPREDRIRALARCLKVDDLWLSAGRSPTKNEASLHNAAQAEGPALMLAGLCEVLGGSAVFNANPKPGQTHLTLSHAGRVVWVVAVLGARSNDGNLAYLIPQPLGEARVVAVVPEEGKVRMFDVTGAKCQTHGGFAIATLKPTSRTLTDARGIRFKELDSLLEIFG